MVTAEHFFGVRVAVKTLLAQPARKVSMDMFGCILPVLVVYSYIYIYIYLVGICHFCRKWPSNPEDAPTMPPARFLIPASSRKPPA